MEKIMFQTTNQILFESHQNLAGQAGLPEVG
jgi:hypothetical protein